MWLDSHVYFERQRLNYEFHCPPRPRPRPPRPRPRPPVPLPLPRPRPRPKKNYLIKRINTVQ